MKQKTYLKIFSLLFLSLFFSCSDDDNNTPPIVEQTPALIKRITTKVYISTDDIETYITDFTYEGSQLKRFGFESNYTEFTYSGEQIAFAKQYRNGTLEKTNGFVYENNKLMTVTSEDERTIFNYNGQGKVASVQYQYLRSDNTWASQGSESFLFAGNNVSQVIQTSSWSNSKSQFTYDDKNNPMRDMNPYFRMLYGIAGVHPMSENNYITQAYFSTPTATIPSANYHNEITYNDKNFPILIKRLTSSNQMSESTEIEYEVALTTNAN